MSTPDTAPRPSASVASAEGGDTPIRVGIVGYGLAGRVFHAPFLQASPEYRISLVSTSDADRAAQVRERHPGADVVASADELFARSAELDMVVIASPASAHLRQGLQALDAHLAVVMDKPIVPTVDEALMLIERAEALGVPFSVFQNRRWDGDFLTVKALIASGRLGEVHRFESTFERWGGPVRDRWQDRETPADAAGISYDLGSHLIDQALELFGPVADFAAELATVRDGSASDDDAFYSLLHESGVQSHITVSRVAALAGPRFRVLGTAGAYAVHGLDPQEPLLKEGAAPTDPGFGEAPEAEWGTLVEAAGDPAGERIPTERGRYADFYARMADAVRGRGPVPVDPRDSLETVRIVELAHRRTAGDED
ncbi:Gfo/Idh/MocA family oxidoreductase [Clavibacter michiganensis]|uniref:Gfo/Idh/MocA family protein n=1 Tax=Clavibacter michiganensis TaxID=28447 RepID=UPI00293124EC|nr:Gfo/Idh/MocA family oxidoreductase [Clavibacter michiganensis]